MACSAKRSSPSGPSAAIRDAGEAHRSRLDSLLQRRRLRGPGPERGRRLVPQLAARRRKHRGNLRRHTGQGHSLLLPAVAHHQRDVALGQVARPDLDPHGYALELPVDAAPPETGVGAVVEAHPVPLGAHLVDQRHGRRANRFVVFDHHDHHLRRRQGGRQAQAEVVAVPHDEGPHETRRDAPGGLPHMLDRALRVGEGDVEGSGEVLAELVAGPHLQRLAVAHHPLAGPRPVGAGEALAGRLVPREHGQAQHVDHGGAVHVVEDAQRVRAGVLLGRVRRMPFLPEELARAQEEARPQLPPHHVGPLVDEQWQVAVALDPLGEEGVDDRLAGWPHHEGLLQLLAATMGDHGQLGGEPLDVLGFEPQVGLRDEEREVRVFGARPLYAAIELGLHQLPNAVAPGPDDHGAAGRPVVGQLGTRDHLLVPTREVRLPRHDGALAHRKRVAVG